MSNSGENMPKSEQNIPKPEENMPNTEDNTFNPDDLVPKSGETLFVCKMIGNAIIHVEIAGRSIEQLNWDMCQQQLSRIVGDCRRKNPDAPRLFAFMHCDRWLRIYVESSPEQLARVPSCHIQGFGLLHPDGQTTKFTIDCISDRKQIDSFVLEILMPKLGLSVLSMPFMGRQVTWECRCQACLESPPSVKIPGRGATGEE
ncbi:uncharacterized protein BO97DRAFT_411930 [Aspergillus homomorphus CBS 101889]|uniref:Uncharacterized protein n=1 Tax=Aspergillus homomorphus (strain CBS 101889) TaxID=1450537 RepID=A0A395I7B1_ASPHC|nr:hypothetical protein BO97DRAFT_411930 [Aspergillus homomorphus CBS 101889]RAL15173.1 hypothetical protein BO97DRAFT_411930 [Aspergillus homomorphus CBS 101889]